jgi:hypothetical protein
MKGIILIFTVLTILVPCHSMSDNKSDRVTNVLSIHNRLNDYFEAFRLKPSIYIKNIEGNQTEIDLRKHKIKWVDTEFETKIKIDNDLFSLKDKATLNIVWDKYENVDFVNNWDEIKLFRYNNRELIGIRMSFQPCSGLACSVDYFLIYDVLTKTKNFFGTFRTDNKLDLFDFHNDDKLDYVAKTFNGDAQGSTPMDFIYELYSMDTNGQFKAQKNSSGMTYQLKYTTFPNDTTLTEKFEQNWITEIK